MRGTAKFGFFFFFDNFKETWKENNYLVIFLQSWIPWCSLYARRKITGRNNNKIILSIFHPRQDIFCNNKVKLTEIVDRVRFFFGFEWFQVSLSSLMVIFQPKLNDVSLIHRGMINPGHHGKRYIMLSCQVSCYGFLNPHMCRLS